MRRISQLFIVLALLLSSLGVVPVAAVQDQGYLQPASQESPQLPGTQVFMPMIRVDPSYTVSGKVTDSQGKPVSNVKIVAKDGQSAFTDGGGTYSLAGLAAGSNAVAPVKGGLVFSPALSQVKLPQTSSPLDFKAYLQCPNFIINDSFETSDAWQLPATEYTAAYTTAAAHTGTRAMRTGITSSSQNKYSYSSTRQPIKIPAGTTSAILRLWLYPISSDTSALAMPSLPMGAEMDSEVLGSDGQYVLVTNTEGYPYDPNTGQLLETLLWMRSNEQQWGLYEFNLTKYASATSDVWIKVQAGTYNDGVGGVTAMYVDDVTLELCDAGAAPPAPVPAPVGCSNAFTNSDFELADRGWSIPVTAFSARYSWTQAHSANQSMRTGIVDTAKNIYSYSDAWQLGYIPKDATSATLNMWIYPNSSQVVAGNTTTAKELLPAAPQAGEAFGNAALAGDMQYVLLLDQYGYILKTLWWERWNYTTWMPLSFDLSDYAGMNVRIQFGTYNDGYDGITAMYVDDATLDICTGGGTPGPTPTPAPSPTPAPTPIPGTCNEGFLNNGFESDSDWGIPVTAFTAGYSTEQVHTGLRSMRNGVPYYVHDRYSYSDAYQVASIPLTVTTSKVGMWIYPISGELATAQSAERPTAELLSTEATSGDVQYVLVLDRYGNWIDTLMWQRKNAQVWGYKEFDVSKWIGTTIRLQFGVYNNGYGGATSMYVDDASLQLCP